MNKRFGSNDYDESDVHHALTVLRFERLAASRAVLQRRCHNVADRRSSTLQMLARRLSSQSRKNNRHNDNAYTHNFVLSGVAFQTHEVHTNTLHNL